MLIRENPWPPDLIAYLQDKPILDGWILDSAWQSISKGQILDILSTIRTKILDFILALNKEIPELKTLKLSSVSNPDQQQKATQIFHNHFGEITGNLAIGSNDISQNINLNIPSHDIDALKKELSKLGISEDYLEMLDEAIAKDGNNHEKNSFGENVSIWLCKVLSMGKKLFGKVSISVASKLIVDLLLNYYSP